MKVRLALLKTFLFALVAQLALAQSKEVTGTVTSADDGQPLPGATVIVQGTTTGTVTDLDGNYSLNVSEGQILVFGYVGFTTKEITVGPANEYDISLKQDALGLDEVVVTGQGLGINKRRISTTVSSISSKDIQAVPAVQLDQLIQSKLPNAQIKLSSGQPGTASIIRSRGPVSAVTNTTPVIFIDGMRVDNLNSSPSLGIGTGGAQSSAIADIPLEDIERIEYIPGGAATTLYGADAANGVLQIFTKRGQASQDYVNFEVQLGAISGTRDFLRYERTAEALFEPGLLQNYRVGFGGGDGKTNYSFSGNMYQDDSFNDINSTVRRNVRATLSSYIKDNFKYATSFAFANMEFNRDYNANTSFARFGNMEGATYGNLDEYTDEEFEALEDQLRREGELTDIVETVNRFQWANNFTYNILENLSASVDLGIDSRNSVQREALTNELLIVKGSAAEGTTNQGTISVSQRNFNVISGNFNLQHEQEVSDFSFITTLGTQFFRENDIQRLIDAQEVVDGSVSINNSASQSAQDFYDVITSYGFYVAENAGFKNRLFLDLGLRLDGNSAFGEEIGLIALPKVGASFILTETEAFKGLINPDVLSFFKIRANYGQSSVFPRAFANDLTFNGPSYLGSLAFAFANPGDPELTSEVATTVEAGLDLGLIKNRVNIGFTYYNTVTDGALFTPPAQPSTGQQAQLTNVGEIENTGFELSAQVVALQSEDHSLTIGASYNYNDNLVVSTGGAPEFAVGGFTFLGSFVGEGQPLGYLRGSQTTLGPNGEPNIEANAFLGTTFSPSFGSFSLSYSYKNKVNFFLNGDYQFGGSGVNVDDVLRFFVGEQDEDRFPTELTDPSLGLTFFDLASYWVEETDYLKIRNISIGYVIGDLGGVIRNAEVSFSALNPLNFVKSNFDPDVTGAGIAAQGGFAGGGFGFGTESAPRMFVGTLKFRL